MLHVSIPKESSGTLIQDLKSHQFYDLFSLHFSEILKDLRQMSVIIKVIGKNYMYCHWSVWEDNIKMDLHEVGCGGMNWIELAKDRDRWRALVNAVMILRVP